jgi:nanoRNase/pAp phosphatase (c-di-AMP/oligoRNAs hydrolase)
MQAHAFSGKSRFLEHLCHRRGRRADSASLWASSARDSHVRCRLLQRQPLIHELRELAKRFGLGGRSRASSVSIYTVVRQSSSAIRGSFPVARPRAAR